MVKAQKFMCATNVLINGVTPRNNVSKKAKLKPYIVVAVNHPNL